VQAPQGRLPLGAPYDQPVFRDRGSVRVWGLINVEKVDILCMFMQSLSDRCPEGHLPGMSLYADLGRMLTSHW
jgi:hypothetical protein